jgi:hypothetical protein
MERVEKRLELLGVLEESIKLISEIERSQLLAFTTQLAEPALSVDHAWKLRRGCIPC